MAEWVTATVHAIIDQERRAKPEVRADVISKVFPSDLLQSAGLHHLQVYSHLSGPTSWGPSVPNVRLWGTFPFQTIRSMNGISFSLKSL